MNPTQYEQVRARVAEAVRRALPVDPEDGTVYLGSTDGVPLWGHPSNVVHAITAEVMQAIDPPPPVPDPVAGPVSGRWSCGCGVAACNIRWDIYRDASADPSQAIRGTCLTHALVADSDTARCAEMPGMRQRADVLALLDRMHQEQCR